MGVFNGDDKIKNESEKPNVGSDNVKSNLKEDVDRIKQQVAEELKEVEKVEQEILGENDSVKGLWRDTFVEIANALDPENQIRGIRRSLYDTVRKVSGDHIDPYRMEADRSLEKARKYTVKIGTKLNGIESKLNRKIGLKEGVNISLAKNEKLAKTYANGLARTKQSLREYQIELTKMQEELRELYENNGKDSEVDYSTDTEYTNGKIQQVQTEIKGLNKDIRILSGKLYRCDKKVKTKRAISDIMESVRDRVDRVNIGLEGIIDVVAEYVAYGSFIGGTLPDLLIQTDTAVGMKKRLGEVETMLGDKMCEALKLLQEKVNAAEDTGDREYMDKINYLNNEDRQTIMSEADKLISEYATVPHK